MLYQFFHYYWRMTGWQLREPEAPSSRWTEFLSKAQTRHCWDWRSRTARTISGKPKVIRLRKKCVNLRSDSTCLMQEGRITNAFEVVGSRKAPWGHPLHLPYPWPRTSFQPPSPWNAASPALQLPNQGYHGLGLPKIPSYMQWSQGFLTGQTAGQPSGAASCGHHNHSLFPPTSLHTADSTKTAGTKCAPSLPCTPANKHACSGHILVASPTCEHPASTTGSGQGHRRVPSRGQSLMMSNRPLRIEAMELSKPEEFPAVPHRCGQTVMMPISPVQSSGPHREEEWCDPDAQTLWLWLTHEDLSSCPPDRSCPKQSYHCTQEQAQWDTKSWDWTPWQCNSVLQTPEGPDTGLAHSELLLGRGLTRWGCRWATWWYPDCECWSLRQCWWMQSIIESSRASEILFLSRGSLFILRMGIEI